MTFPRFSLRVPGDIRFGRGEAAAAIPDMAGFGGRLLLVHGANATRVAWLADGLRQAGVEVLGLACAGEPDLDMLQDAVAQAREFAPDAVIACGGGAALDLGKAVAALVAEAHPPLEYLEVVGNGRTLAQTPVPFIAVPTTSGTGAEATKNAVIGVPEHRRKVSLRDDRMLARLVVVDPSLTDGCPRPVTLASGLDACVQVIEPFLCRKANPVTDALCSRAIPAGLDAVAWLMREESPLARDALAWVSLTGGMALANAGLGAVHGLAGPLGGVTGAAHGALCGRLLPPVLDAYRAAGLAEQPDSRLPWVIDQIDEALQIGPRHDGRTLEEWLDDQSLPRLGDMGLDPGDVAGVAEAAQTSSSMKASPVMLDAGQLAGVLNAAM